ncbi:Asp-tRNA(Asn)/Glu-tRNA(Gln) amidotransferase GatCAB subunit A, partial [Eggerthella lenta]
AFAPGQPYPEGSMADIPDAADATPGVDLPGLLTEEGGFGVAHQASSAAQRGLSERLGNAEAAPFQVEKAGE